MPKRSSKKQTSRDINELAASVVGQVTGEAEAPSEEKNPHAVALGRMGGLKGGKARADKLTSVRRREIAKNAAQARWGSK